MTAHILDGRAVAFGRRTALATHVATLPFQPGLAVVLVGEDPASAVYVRNKDRAATGAGLAVQTIRLPDTATETELLAIVMRLNDDPAVDGILVQMPLPAHIRTDRIVDAIDPAKDVDGLHPINAGRAAAGQQDALVPCTPLGVMRLLEAAGTVLAGRRALVLGRSALVGRPVAGLLIAANATVTVAHSHTRDLAAECRRAEVLVAAVGRAGLVRGDWLLPRAVVIDVGINRGPDGRLIGDVAYQEALGIAGAITPVPGGVGPMTIACLLDNTVKAAQQRRGFLDPLTMPV